MFSFHIQPPPWSLKTVQLRQLLSEASGANGTGNYEVSSLLATSLEPKINFIHCQFHKYINTVHLVACLGQGMQVLFGYFSLTDTYIICWMGVWFSKNQRTKTIKAHV